MADMIPMKIWQTALAYLVVEVWNRKSMNIKSRRRAVDKAR
jgi:hypothetical protein